MLHRNLVSYGAFFIYFFRRSDKRVYTFGLKTRIYTGTGSLEKLREMKWNTAFVVTDPFMVKCGAVNKVTDELTAAGIKFEIFSDIVPDPPIETVVKGMQAMMAVNPDAVIAMGGGSAIDAAKAICSFNREINKTADSKVVFVAIPTTSGTGSEVTSFSVITDREKNVKYPLVSEDLMPDIAILDAELVKTVPDFITADTGMDVLTHAIEAYVSTSASDFTDALAEKAIKLVFEYLPRAYANGNDEEAREKMHNASCIAGVAFTNASLGLNHGMAHILGGKFHVPHGRTNAILLPYVIEYNADLKDYSSRNFTLAAQRYAQIAKLLGLPASNVRLGVKSLVNAIKNLSKSFKLPSCIKETGVKEEDFKKELKSLAEAAIADRCTATNPRVPEAHEVEKLFERVYNGR